MRARVFSVRIAPRARPLRGDRARRGSAGTTASACRRGTSHRPPIERRYYAAALSCTLPLNRAGVLRGSIGPPTLTLAHGFAGRDSMRGTCRAGSYVTLIPSSSYTSALSFGSAVASTRGNVLESPDEVADLRPGELAWRLPAADRERTRPFRIPTSLRRYLASEHGASNRQLFGLGRAGPVVTFIVPYRGEAVWRHRTSLACGARSEPAWHNPSIRVHGKLRSFWR